MTRVGTILLLVIAASALPTSGDPADATGAGLLELARRAESRADHRESVEMVRAMSDEERLAAAELLGGDPDAAIRMFGLAAFFEARSLPPLMRLLEGDATFSDPRVTESLEWSLAHSTEAAAAFSAEVARAIVDRQIEKVRAAVKNGDPLPEHCMFGLPCDVAALERLRAEWLPEDP